MPVSEARKRANAKWDRANTVTLACKAPRILADQFRMICEQRSTSTNAVLLAYVKEVVRMHEAQE